MKVEVRPVGKRARHTLANLLQLYLHDFSEFDGGEVSADGLFGYPYLEQYWEQPDRYAFLILADEMLAGFALVKKGSELAGDMQAMDVAEFFILRGWRRKGVGTEAFHALVRRFPGSWLVRVQDNVPGTLSFWQSTIPAVSKNEVVKERLDDGERRWTVFRFSVPTSTGDP